VITSPVRAVRGPGTLSRVDSDQPGDSSALAGLTSTSGYAEQAAVLAGQYERVTFEAAFGTFLPYLPVPPCRVADIGAGTGRDAAWLAARGYEVTAVEPVPEMRAAARRLHAGANVRWVDDTLPALGKLSGEFGLIQLRAVWMHLDAAERARALPRVAALLAEGGRVILTLPHGPVPAGRRMFDVAPEEITSAGAALGLALLHRGHAPDTLGRAEVTWTNLIFEQARPGKNTGPGIARGAGLPLDSQARHSR